VVVGGELGGAALAAMLVDEAAGGDGERSHVVDSRETRLAVMNALDLFIA
jgi:hypothetical protein